jgi:hypothetical protein
MIKPGYRHFATILAMASVSAFAGMYDNPWALVQTADRSDVKKEFPVAITQVDGQSTRSTRETDPIAPGKHVIKVRFETGRVSQSPADEERNIQLDLEGCTLYRIAARRTQGTEWEPKVYSEPIGECARKFKKK